jgi:hypothetical protein
MGEIVKNFKVLLACLFMPGALLAQSGGGPAPSAQKMEQSTATVPAPKAAPQQSAADQAAPKIDPAKEAAIRKLLEAQGMTASFKAVIANMSENMKPLLNNSLPPGDYREKLIELFFKKFQSKFKVEDFLAFTIPSYDKHFTLAEIEGLTAFYSTPLGRKLVAVQPDVMKESQVQAMQLGQQIGQQSMMEVLDEHPELKKAMEDAASAPRN